LASTKFSAASAPAGWARSTEPATRSSIATSPSKSSPLSSPAIPIASRASYPYAVASDGQRFLIESSRLADDADLRAPLTVVLNWQEELKRVSK